MRIAGKDLRRIYAHATAQYPYECFGFLVGTHADGGHVLRVVPGTNVRTDRPDRFEMKGEEFLAVESAAERDRLEVIGFYHSHPDWPAVPSEEDVRLAWSGTYYLIVSISSWHPVNVAVWQMGSGNTRHFTQVACDVLGDNPPAGAE